MTVNNKQEPYITNYKTEGLSPVLLTIFGITGDLSSRKLLPSLYQLVKHNLLAPKTKIIGVTRRDITKAELLSKVELCIREENKTCDPAVIKRLTDMISVLKLDLTTADGFSTLARHLDELEHASGQCMSKLFYLSVPPGVLLALVKKLGENGFNKACRHGELSRILFEKPFGYDLKSGQELVDETAKFFSNKQVFRIDHYVAKETVQNIITFRFRNPIFEDVWRHQYIDKLEIVATESIDIEGRANFYEQTGAMRDLVQSHLLQLLTSVTMERPLFFDSTRIHEAKLQVLSHIKPIAPNQVDACAVRGQYNGYKKEVNKPDSFVETFAALKLCIDTPRWKDVPIIIKTGKALDRKATFIKVHFRSEEYDKDHLNVLTFHIQPEEGIDIDLWVKKPGFEKVLQQANMTFSYQKTFNNDGHPDAYDRVLVDAIKGDQTLFATSEEVVESWRIIDSVISEWAKNSNGLKEYAKGSEGPRTPHDW